MDCFTKKIVFKKLGYLELEFESDRRILPTCIVSSIKAKRLLCKGCKAYLAHIVDKSTLEVTLDNVPIGREFLNVFSKDLPSLPPNKELKFEIGLLPCSAPVFIPHHRI